MESFYRTLRTKQYFIAKLELQCNIKQTFGKDWWLAQANKQLAKRHPPLELCFSATEQLSKASHAVLERRLNVLPLIQRHIYG
jgi:hypothetical protein